MFQAIFMQKLRKCATVQSKWRDVIRHNYLGCCEMMHRLAQVGWKCFNLSEKLFQDVMNWLHQYMNAWGKRRETQRKQLEFLASSLFIQRLSWTQKHKHAPTHTVSASIASKLLQLQSCVLVQHIWYRPCSCFSCPLLDYQLSNKKRQKNILKNTHTARKSRNPVRIISHICLSCWMQKPRKLWQKTQKW